jgi:hypothetical protein
VSAERRDAPRFPISLDCALKPDHLGFQACRMRDLSQAGAFVVTNRRRLTDHSRVELAVRISRGGKVEMVSFPALVRYVTPDGAGLYFTATSDQSRSLLDMVMANRRHRGLP